MSLTRLIHDGDAYEKSVLQSASSGHYMLQTPRICGGGSENSIEGFFPQVNQGQNAASLCEANNNLVDIDSDLMGITHKLSHCPPLPPSKFQLLQTDILKAPVNPGCGASKNESTFLTNENSRMTSAGSCTLRCTGINRFDPLLFDVQKYWSQNIQPVSTNSRILMKDQYKPCLREPIEETPQPTEPNGYDTYTDLSKYTSRNSTELPTLAQMPKRFGLCIDRNA